MAKQKSIGASFEDDFEDEFEDEFDLDADAEIEVNSVQADAESHRRRSRP